MVVSNPLKLDAPLETILVRVAEHMLHLAETLAATEAAVAQHFKEALAHDLGAFQDVQNLDYLHQSMIDTATLLNSLSTGCRTQTSIAEKLNLETTRALIRTQPEKSEPSESGVIDLF